MQTALPATRRLRVFGSYAAMLAATALVYLWIRSRGEQLSAPAPAESTGPGVLPQHSTVLAHFLLALAVITVLARFFGGFFRRYLHQPPVIGEMVAGLALGPSVLGAISPAAYDFLLPASTAPYVSVISKVGVVLFMFLVGLDLDLKLLRGQTHTAIAISHASIIFPFVLGAGLALSMYPLYSSHDVSFTVFSLFLGVSMSVTAFPVLARILVDRRVQHTPLGAAALACAAVDDATAWSLLAFVAAVATSQVGDAAWTVGLVLCYVAVMVFVVRPLASRFVEREQRSQEPLSHTAFAIVLTALLLSAVATEAIGIHALFGAFLLGAILPNKGRLPDQIRARLVDVVLVLFLPSFFAFTGMRTQIGLLDSARDWWVCGLVILVATLGKFGGTFCASRLTGLGWRQSAMLGTLMNTRGLMELIVLNLGLDMKVITPTVFTMMIIMAIVTTFATTPVLRLLQGRFGLAEVFAIRRDADDERVRA
jgi:Kef-type K+ transport system membrane component KefB